MPSPYGYEASFEMAITAAIIFTAFIIVITMQMIKYRAWFWNTAVQAAVGKVHHAVSRRRSSSRKQCRPSPSGPE